MHHIEIAPPAHSRGRVRAVLCACLLLLVLCGTAAAWLDGYEYRQPITLTGGASGAQTDYQVLLNVTYDAHMQANFSDLRFTNESDGLIDAWLESNTTDYALVWVEFPTTPANTVEQDYYMYYGNAGAVSDWDIGAAFIQGDDFEVAGAGDWTAYVASPAYDSTTQAKSPTHSMQCSNTGVEGAYIAQTASDNIAVDCWIYIDSVVTRAWFFGHGDGTDAILLASIGQDIKYYDTAWRDTGINTALDTWKQLSVYDFNWSAGTFKINYDGNVANCNVRQNNAADANRIVLRIANAVTYYDDFHICKYTLNPATYAFGAEESTTPSPIDIVNGIYGFLSTSIPANSTIAAYKAAGIMTIESTLDWDAVTSGTWNPYLASVQYCYDQNRRSAMRLNLDGDYNSSAYRESVKQNITAYLPDLSGDPYQSTLQYIVLNLTNASGVNSTRAAFVNEIGQNISEQTGNKFKTMILEDLQDADPAYVGASPIIYKSLTTVSDWIDFEAETLRGNITLSRVYSGNESFLTNLTDYRDNILNRMRGTSATANQYSEVYSVKVDNGDIILFNNGSAKVNRTVADASAGYYWAVTNDTLMNLSTGAGTVGFYIPARSYGYILKESSLDRIIYVNDQISQLWAGETTVCEDVKYHDGIMDASYTWSGDNTDIRAEFWDPTFTRENTFMIHYEWINVSVIKDYSVYDYIIIADKNANEINNTIARLDCTYGYVSVGDYADTAVWQAGKTAEIDDWCDNFSVNVFIDGIDSATLGENASIRLKDLADHVHDKDKKVIMNTYTYYQEFATYGDAVMKESCFSRWGGSVNDPTYTWENMTIEKERSDYYTSQNIPVLGMSFGDLEDYDKMAFDYAAFAVLYGLTGDNTYRYGQPNFQAQKEINVYPLGTMLEPSYTETSDTDWNRLYQAGRLHINPEDHTWWVDDNKQVNNLSVDVHFYAGGDWAGGQHVKVFANSNEHISTLYYYNGVDPLYTWVWRSCELDKSVYADHGHYYVYMYYRGWGGGWNFIGRATQVPAGNVKTWYDATTQNLPETTTGQTWNTITPDNWMMNLTVNYTTSAYVDELIDRISQTPVSTTTSGYTITHTTTISSNRDIDVPVWSAAQNISAFDDAKTYVNDSSGNWMEIDVNNVADASAGTLTWNYTVVDGGQYGAVREPRGNDMYLYRFLLPHTSIHTFKTNSSMPVPSTPVDISNTISSDWVNHTWQAGSGGTLYMVSGEDYGVFYGFNWTGSTWQGDSEIIGGLGDIGSGSAPTAFRMDETWHLISGNYTGTFSGYNWTGSAWQSDSAIVGGLGDVGGFSTPTVFRMAGTWYLVSGEEDGVFNGCAWNGSAWQSDSGIVSGLGDVGQNSAPTIFEMGGIWYLITGKDTGTFSGYNWTGTAWQSDSEVISGLNSIGGFSTPAVFEKDGIRYLLTGTSSGIFGGYNWTGTAWQSDSGIQSGLGDIGRYSAPTSFNIDGNATNSYNVRVNGVWYNGTTDTFYNHTYPVHAWQNITIYAYNSRGTGTLSADSISQNTQIQNNPVTITNTSDWSGEMGGNVYIDYGATDADNDTLIFSCNRTDLFADFSTTNGTGNWTAAAGTFYIDFGVSDGYGSTDNYTMTIIANATPPNPLGLANVTGNFWVNHTWGAGREGWYLVAGEADGVFYGYNWTGSAWQSDSGIVGGLGDIGDLSEPTVFQKDGTWYLISGEAAGVFYGYNWTGSAWQSDSGIVSGLGDIGDRSEPTVFQKDGTWYLVAGESGAFNGYNWTGSAWQSDSGIVSGLGDVGSDSEPTVFQKDGTWYLISGETAGVFYGYNWTGSAWQSDSGIVSGLGDIGLYSKSTVFQKDGTWYLIAGKYTGTFSGYNWTGTAWQSDSVIASGLGDVGYHSVPSAFFMGYATDSYNVSVNSVWHNTSPAYYNDTYTSHTGQNITVWAYNTSGAGTLSAGSISHNTQIPNNPVTITNTSDWSGVEGENVYVAHNATDADNDTLIFSCNRTDLFTDFNTAAGVGNWTTTYIDEGTYYVDFGVSDGWGSTSNYTMTIIVASAEAIPPDPKNIQSTSGNFWVNHSWAAGTGNITESYNVSVNSVWHNTTTNTHYNDTYTAHAWQNITIYAYNTSGTGILSAGSVNQNAQIPNNPITITNTSDWSGVESENIYVDHDATDADSDTPTFSCNRTDLFADFSAVTGAGNWTTTYLDEGTYYVDFGVSDGWGATSNYTMMIIVASAEAIPPNPLNLTNTTGNRWVNHTWDAGRRGWHLIAGEIDGVFTGYNRGSTWQGDSGIVDGLGSVEYNSAPTVFQMAGTWYLITGELDGTFIGYNWTGSIWQSDSGITSGLGDTGRYSVPTTFWKEGTWYLIAGEETGSFTGYNWTGSAWQSDSGIVSGLGDVGSHSTPTTFQKDGTWYLIAGNDTGTFTGYNWTGSAWQSDSVIASGLGDVGYNSAPMVFEKAEIWHLISGKDTGTFSGYNWTGSAWQSDSGIVSGLGDVGYNSAPMVFDMNNITDSYNISVNSVWHNGTADAFYNDTYTPDAWQNITVYAFNTSGTGTLSTGSISQNTQATGDAPYIPPNPINLANTTGNFWVHHTWTAGSGNVTDGYNASVNSVWHNGTPAYYNDTYTAHTWQNITVWAYNASGMGTLSPGSVSQDTQIPNNPITITNTSDWSGDAGANVYVDYDATDADSDTPTFSCNRTDLFTDFSTTTGKGNWTAASGTYYVDFGVSDGWGSTSNYTMTIIVASAEAIPPDPVNLANTTGNFWVHHTWTAGSGNVTNSYNVLVNSVWHNGTPAYYNDTYTAHTWQNITVWAYNASGNGTLSPGSVSQDTQIPNNPITITNTSDWSGDAGANVYVDYDATDADSDTPTFSCNRTDLFTDFSTTTGKGNWTAASGTYYVDFGVSDGYGSTSNYTMTITVGALPSDPYIPPNPINLANTTGNFWVHHTWTAGSGNVTNSYNVLVNSVWHNTSPAYYNDTYTAHAWQNITVWAYNASSNGTLSPGSVSQDTQIPNNPVTITNTSGWSGDAGANVYVDYDATDADSDTPTFSCNRTDLFTDFSTATGTGNWTAASGTYYVDFGVSDGYGSTSNYTMTITVGTPSAEAIPPDPVNLANTTGNFWVHHTWTAGSGNVTNSYNVLVNSVWHNGTPAYYNDTYTAHAWQNITVYAYNASGNGTLSPGSVSQDTQIPNNPITITNTSGWSGDAGANVYVDYDATDADSDTPTFSCNRTDLFTDFSTATGTGNWTAASGTYYVDFGVSDGYGSTSNYTMRISQFAAPDKPTLVAPANGATGTSTSPTLRVTVTDPDADIMSVTFYQQGGTQIGSTQTGIANGSTASVVWSGRSYSTTYYWYAVANDGNASTQSDTWHFRTQSGGGGGSSHTISITGCNDWNGNAGTTAAIDFGYINDDHDSPVFSTNATMGTLNTATGVWSWATGAGDVGVYHWWFRVKNAYGNSDDCTITVTVHTGDTPLNLGSTTGNFWVDHTWNAVAGASDYRVRVNGVWHNGTATHYLNTLMAPHGWSNITLASYNTSAGCSSFISDNVQIPNNPITITNYSDQNVFVGDNVTVDLDYADLDGDTPTFSCSRTDLFTDFNTATGTGTWTTAANGTFEIDFGVSDDRGSVSNCTMRVRVGERATLPTTIPISIWIVITVLMFGFVIYTLHVKGYVQKIFGGMISVIMAYIQSQQIVSGNVVQITTLMNSADVMVTEKVEVVIPELAYLLLFVAVIMSLVTAVFIMKYVQYLYSKANAIKTKEEEL